MYGGGNGQGMPPLPAGVRSSLCEHGPAMLPPSAPTCPSATPMPAAASRRPHCARCLRPASTCLCRWATATANRVRLLVLQHPQEQHHAKGTVRLLQLSLQQCQVAVATPGADGAGFDPAALAQWLVGAAVGSAVPAQSAGCTGPPVSSWLLYPAAPRSALVAGPAEAPAQAALPLAQPQALQLVLLDGTWRQSRQLLRHHPALQQLPRWPLPTRATQRPPAYPLRRAHRPEQRSSLEAACHSLALLEGQPARYEPLLAAFTQWQAALLQGR